MPMTGTLLADFSSFSTAAQKAEVALRGMEGGAVKVEAALDNMAGGSTAPMNSLRESIGQVDQTLSSAGVNVGKYARALDEMAKMSGKTVTEIGGLAAGASIFSAAMAGWQFGTWIAGVTGLDQAVLGLADSLTNLPAEVAAAKQDTINRAIANGAKETINYNEAVKFNIQHVTDQANAYAVSSERLAAAQKEIRGLSDATLAGIEIALKNKATTEQITAVYKISADGLRVLAEQKKLSAEAADKHAAAQKREEAAARAYDVEIANQIVLFDNLNKAAKAATDLKTSNAAAAGWISQQVAIKKGIDDEAAATRAYLTEQDALTAATDALSQAHTTAGTAAVSATAGAIAGYQGVAQQVQLSGDAIKEWIALMKYAAQANAINTRNSLFQTTSQAEALANLSGPSLSAGRQAGAFAGRGGASVVNNISIVDTESNIARRLSAHVTDSVLRMGPV